MGKSSHDADIGANCKKYGVPFYGASFVPRNALRSSETESKREDEIVGDGSNYVVFAGGGGEGRSGIPNALVISLFDSASNSLSDQPVSPIFSYIYFFIDTLFVCR